MRRPGRGARTGRLLAPVLGALLVAGCSGPVASLSRSSADTGEASTAASPHARAAGAAYQVPAPGRYPGPLRTADVLVTSRRPIPAAVRARVAHLHGVAAVLPLSLASMSTNGRTLTIAAGDPGRFRDFTPLQSARADSVWQRVADGEVAVDASLPRRLADKGGYLRLGSSRHAPDVHIGAYAPLVKEISAFVNERRAAELGMPRDNGLLISTGELTPSAVTDRIKRVVGKDATLETLALELDVDAPRTAVLSGGTVASAVGNFSYTPHPDGRVSPDPAWVHRYIRTEQVPLLGAVTCNRVMLVQLRAALQEIVSRGLADRIHPGEYGGCYYPRYIAYDPAKGLSLHTWGIAIDLNVPENQRGTAGRMDPQVVAIFRKWGFAWGGDWHYTDPMHFELAALVHPG
ncbi:MAG: M15 family metallopeptidase [Nocardioidaceae bacterium]